MWHLLPPKNAAPFPRSVRSAHHRGVKRMPRAAPSSPPDGIPGRSLPSTQPSGPRLLPAMPKGILSNN